MLPNPVRPRVRDSPTHREGPDLGNFLHRLTLQSQDDHAAEAAEAEIAAQTNGKSVPAPVAASERKEPDAPKPHRYEPPQSDH